MVKIAVAGGSGQVAREVIDVLAATKKHEISILTRSSPSTATPPGTEWLVVDYNDTSGLVEVLRGIHTVLSFVQLLSDPDQKSQKNLIDAAIRAGVKRFAPSEYGSKGTVNMAWWAGKENIRDYLRQVNERGNVLEYTLFQPGLFLDYLAFPHKAATHVDPLQTVFDFENRRAVIVQGHKDAVMTLTSVADLAAMIARAVDYDGTWPASGGISGNRLTFSEVIGIGEAIRGNSFTIEEVKMEDLEAGKLHTSWGLEAVHRAVDPEEASALLKAVSIGILLSSVKGAWDSSDEFNQLFPDHEFASARQFLAKVWEGKP